MNKYLGVLGAGILALNLMGCTTTEKGAAVGGLTGATLGGIIGHQSGHGGTGAAIGAAAGVVGGMLVGEKMQRDEDANIQDAVDKKFCPKCGMSYSVDVKFCPKDGTELRYLEN